MTLVHTGDAGLWTAFALTVTSMLALDLGLLQRRPRAPTTREALAWSAVWVAVAAVFGVGLASIRGPETSLAFFTGYLVEKALSLDNLFVMLLVFGHFAVPEEARRKVLAVGIVSAIAMRSVLIVAGAALVERFHALTYVLGALLVVAAAQMLRGGAVPESTHGVNGASTAEPEGQTKPEGRAVRLVRRLFPVTPRFHGGRFFLRAGGRLHATSLFLALVAIEAADLVFALDSIPAVFAVTTDPLVAITSNVFAMLGLRALYFLLASFLGRLRYLKAGLALVLLFVGAKMLFAFAVHVPVGASLLVIAGLIGGAALLSLRAETAVRPLSTTATKE